MKKVLLVSLALALPLATSPAIVVPAMAKDVEALVKHNCTEAIMGSTAELDRNEMGGFQLAKTGDGYSFSGVDEKHHSVSCLAAADGHVTWVTVG